MNDRSVSRAGVYSGIVDETTEKTVAWCCPKCGYSLVGIDGARCPECGATEEDRVARLKFYERFRRESWRSFIVGLMIAGVGCVIVVLFGNNDALFAYFDPFAILFAGYSLSLIVDTPLFGFGIVLPCILLVLGKRKARESAPKCEMWARSLVWTTAPFWLAISLFIVSVHFIEGPADNLWFSNMEMVFGVLAVLLVVVWNILTIRNARLLGLGVLHSSVLAILGSALTLASGLFAGFMVLIMTMAD